MAVITPETSSFDGESPESLVRSINGHGATVGESATAESRDLIKESTNEKYEGHEFAE